MNWEKKGHIFNVDSNYSWNQTHAQVPVVDTENIGFWRVYYSTRSLEGKSNISFFDVEQGRPENVIYTHKSPILNFGKVGTFDDSGLMPTSAFTLNGRKLLYYIGWTTHKLVPFSNAIGVAQSLGDNEYSKIYEGPIIGRSPSEPFFCGTCYVLKIGDIFHAYYLSCIGWKEFENKMEPLYDLKIARSIDGLKWDCNGDIAINLLDDEGGIASASVIKIGEIYHMWFSVRGENDYRNAGGQTYRLGYAQSNDGVVWSRIQNNGLIEKEESGWDSEMIAYPNVVRFKDELYMFYNGNGFGKSGIGFAKCKI